VAAAAVSTLTADVIALHGRHTIADAKATHCRPGVDHGAADLVTWNDRQLDALAIRAVACDDIEPTDTACRDTDQDVARAG